MSNLGMWEKTRFLWRPGFILFILTLVYFALLIRSDCLNFLKLKKEKAFLAEAWEKETQLLARCREEIARLEGMEAVEEIARTKLGMVKKGENAYKIISERKEGEDI